MHIRLPVFSVIALSACTLTASAAVVPVSASRSAGLASVPGFGVFSQSNTGSGFAPPNGTGSWSSTQNSNITPSTVTFSASYGGGIDSGGPQTTYGIPGVGFSYVFDITDAPQDITYSWGGSNFGPFPSISGTPIGSVSLWTSGATQSLTLPVGHYTVNASDSMFFSAQSIGGGSRSNTGTISFVPAPGAAALLGLGGMAITRRRRAAR